MDPQPAAPGAGAAPPPGWYGVDVTDRAADRPQDPAPALHHLRRVAPVHETPLGFWRLARHADCVRLLREVPAGVRRRDGTGLGIGGEDAAGGGRFMLQQDPPAHTRLRKLVSRAFTPRAVEAWRPRARALVDELLDSALEAGRFDVVSGLARPVPARLICEMLGVPFEDHDRFTAWTADSTHLLAGDLLSAEQRARSQASVSEFAAYFRELLATRRNDLGDDLLSVLIRAEEEGDRLSPEELLVQGMGLLVAGFETTIGLIANGLAALARHPAQFARLRADPELTPRAVEECLRFDPPVVATTRILHADAEFGGIRIPRDAQVFALLAAANRDPERFPEPDRFDVGRDPNPHLSFGGGTHLCLGAHLARMEAQEAIGGLARRARRLELLRDEVAWGRSLFRVPAELPVRAEAA